VSSTAELTPLATLRTQVELQKGIATSSTSLPLVGGREDPRCHVPQTPHFAELGYGPNRVDKSWYWGYIGTYP